MSGEDLKVRPGVSATPAEDMSADVAKSPSVGESGDASRVALFSADARESEVGGLRTDVAYENPLGGGLVAKGHDGVMLSPKAQQFSFQAEQALLRGLGPDRALAAVSGWLNVFDFKA